ncbi:MAG: hypothetical protein IAG10_19940 [Planctomycetaceae bacterium]|nr:hypothetical protein [Planctomycetaceae bacterium]
MQSEEIRRLSERLDKIEWQNRWLRIFLLAFPLLVVTIGAARIEEDEVVADAVITKGIHISHEGKKRIFLGVNPDTNKAVINVWDKNGKLVKPLGEAP